MECYHPLTAYRLEDGSIVFAERGRVLETLTLPCGQCIGCRLRRSRSWAIRCMHEASLWERNCFVTLTFDDEHLPERGCLDYGIFQKFLKRLRRRAKKPVRFFACGEYGDQLRRPHFHACLFNWDFVDKRYLVTTRTGSRVYRSPLLEALWPFGFASIGDVTLESAGYVARYCVKKVVGSSAEEHYKLVNTETGELDSLVPEMAHMSLKPAIGLLWFQKYMSDVVKHGKVLVNGRQVSCPRYYGQLLARIVPEEWERIRAERYARSMRVDPNERSDERLAVREQVQEAAASFLVRGL